MTLFQTLFLTKITSTGATDLAGTTTIFGLFYVFSSYYLGKKCRFKERIMTACALCVTICVVSTTFGLFGVEAHPAADAGSPTEKVVMKRLSSLKPFESFLYSWRYNTILALMFLQCPLLIGSKRLAVFLNLVRAGAILGLYFTTSGELRLMKVQSVVSCPGALPAMKHFHGRNCYYCVLDFHSNSVGGRRRRETIVNERSPGAILRRFQS